MGNSNSDLVKELKEQNKDWAQRFDQQTAEYQKKVTDLISMNEKFLQESYQQQKAQQKLLEMFTQLTSYLGRKITEREAEGKIRQVYAGRQKQIGN